MTSNLLRRCVGKRGEYVVVKIRRSPALWGLFTSVFFSVREINPFNALVYDLLPVTSLFSYSGHVSLRVCNAALLEFVWRYLSSSPFMIFRPIPGGGVHTVGCW